GNWNQMILDPKLRRIPVKTDGGGVMVEAELYGPLAIHASVRDSTEKPPWTITHVATGFSVARFEEKSAAERFVGKLLELQLDWDFKDPTRIPRETARALLGELSKGLNNAKPTPQRTTTSK